MAKKEDRTVMIKALQDAINEARGFTEIDFTIQDKLKLWVGKKKVLIRCTENLKEHIKDRLLRTIYSTIMEKE